MNTSGFDTTDKQKEIIETVRKSFADDFRDTITDYRDAEIGIGVPGRHMFCFFKMDGDRFVLRYRNGKEFCPETEDVDYAEQARQIIALYRSDRADAGSDDAGSDDDSAANAEIKIAAENEIKGEIVDETNGDSVDVKIGEVTVTFVQLEEKYGDLLVELLANIRAIAAGLLNPAGKNVLFSRLGLDAPRKGFDAIAQEMGMSPTEVKHLMGEIIEVFRGAEDERKVITDKISGISLDEFTTYLLLIDDGIRLTPFFYEAYLCEKVSRSALRELQTEIGKKEVENGGAKLYGERHYEVIERIRTQILFGEKKRKLTDEEFGRLKKERRVNTYGDDEFKVVGFGGEDDYCESALQKNIYRTFMDYNLFRSVKIQCLRIPFGTGNGGGGGHVSGIYPTFQCLTHDGYFVVVEVKPIINMSEYVNIRRFECIKNYCERYGFGYLVVDGSYNSFYHVRDDIPEFTEAVLNTIKEKEFIAYPEYKRLLVKYGGSEKTTLTLVRDNNLKLTSKPFRLEFAQKRE